MDAGRSFPGSDSHGCLACDQCVIKTVPKNPGFRPQIRSGSDGATAAYSAWMPRTAAERIKLGIDEKPNRPDGVRIRRLRVTGLLSQTTFAFTAVWPISQIRCVRHLPSPRMRAVS